MLAMHASLEDDLRREEAALLAAELENAEAEEAEDLNLFAVSENGKFKGEEGGGVSSFAIGEDGGLTLISQVNSGGGAPCHISTDPEGKSVLVANYMGGSTSSYQITADGKLVPPAAGGFIQHEGQGAQLPRQASPHAHSVNVDPSGKRAFVADLGLDKVLIYKLDAAAGTIVPNDPPVPQITGCDRASALLVSPERQVGLHELRDVASSRCVEPRRRNRRARSPGN